MKTNKLVVSLLLGISFITDSALCAEAAPATSTTKKIENTLIDYS